MYKKIHAIKSGPFTVCPRSLYPFYMGTIKIGSRLLGHTVVVGCTGYTKLFPGRNREEPYRRIVRYNSPDITGYHVYSTSREIFLTILTGPVIPDSRYICTLDLDFARIFRIGFRPKLMNSYPVNFAGLVPDIR